MITSAQACYDETLSDNENYTSCKKAAEQGLAKAQDNLGVMYAKGEGASQDYVLAHMCLILQAHQGIEMLSTIEMLQPKE